MKKIGGRTYKENIKSVMMRMIDVNVMMQFNMKGVNRKNDMKKRRFDNTMLCQAIIGEFVCFWGRLISMWTLISNLVFVFVFCFFLSNPQVLYFIFKFSLYIIFFSPIKRANKIILLKEKRDYFQDYFSLWGGNVC